MNWNHFLVIITTALLSAKESSCDNSYAIYTSKHVRRGIMPSFTISNLNASQENIAVSASLTSSDNKTNFHTSGALLKNLSKEIFFPQIPVDYDGSSTFTLQVDGFNSENQKIFSNETNLIKLSAKTRSIFIQTDKAIYQPGQTIRFRAIFIDEELRPLDVNVSYQVKCPNGNVILLKTHQQLTLGVIGDELELHKDSTLGWWKIVVNDEVLNNSKEIEVEVKFYKLPKFSVQIDAPSYLHSKSDGITVTVNAKYTFGKPVQGKAGISVSIPQPYYYSYRSGPQAQSRTIKLDIDDFTGSSSKFFTAKQLKGIGWEPSYDHQKLQIFAFAIEQYTDIEMNETLEVDLKIHKLIIKNLYSPTYAKPGLSYTAYVKVSEQDGKILSEADLRANEVVVEYTYIHNNYGYDRTGTDNSEKVYYEIPPSGIIPVTLQLRNESFGRIQFHAWIKSGDGEGENEWWSSDIAESPSNSYIQLNTAQNEIEPGTSASVTVQSSEIINRYQILVMSRGLVVFSETNSVVGSKSHAFSVDITPHMTPSITIIVSYVRQDGEIVADSITLSVALKLENQVSLTSPANVDAGDEVSIDITASQSSYIGLRAIDESVQLLSAQSNDITKDQITDDLDGYSTNSRSNRYRFWGWPMISDASSTYDMFEDANIILLTDALFEKPYNPTYYAYPVMEMDFANDVADDDVMRMPEMVLMSSAGAGGPGPVLTPTIRQYFPETWLWWDSVTNASGSVELRTKAPDTITSWVLSCFSLSPAHGIGVADTVKTTVFRKFFITLNLPLKVIRGEVIIVQAVVFNYFSQNLAVKITLVDGEGFDLILIGDSSKSGNIRYHNIAADQSVSVWFPVRVTQVGEIAFQVKAQSSLAADALIRTVHVRPEGIRKCETSSIVLSEEGGNSSSYQLEVSFPADDVIVEQSQSARLFIYGDIMASTLENLGSLLREPTGCGEQNMIGFAPDVFVVLYLKKANMLHEKIRKKAYKHILKGFQNELNFKHSDGSYSAFGKRDPFGSSWLTAFVAKCFVFTTRVRPELYTQLIPHIMDAFRFLSVQQKNDGSFNEPGKLCHKGMQGGTNSDLTMAAYIIIAFTENQLLNENTFQTLKANVVNKTVSYIESRLSTIVNKPYELAIVTYALHTSGSDLKGQALTYLEDLAIDQNGMRYWSGQASSSSSSYGGSSNDIEMTAYALLTYVHRNDISSAIPIMKWLTSKRNDLGGYSSTQDTVMAIQAMSAMADLVISNEQDLVVSAAFQNFTTNLRLTKENSIVFNQFDLPIVNGEVQLSSSGEGIAVAQLSICYNIKSGLSSKTRRSPEPFLCSVDVQDEGVDRSTLDVCCSVKIGEESTGMFLYEVGLPNGFAIDIDAEQKRNWKAQKVEFEKGFANLYYDELIVGVDTCAQIKIFRTEMVAEVKPSLVIAKDYYQPERRWVQEYSIDSLRNSSVCDICKMKCIGCSPSVNSSQQAVTPSVNSSQQAVTPSVNSSQQAVTPSVNSSQQAVTPSVNSSQQAVNSTLIPVDSFSLFKCLREIYHNINDLIYEILKALHLLLEDIN